MSAKPPVLVLYGSQTGNSRAMAKALGDDATEHGFDTRVLGMDQFKTLEFADVPLLLIVSSTTGNGDAPDNADKFLRYLKRKNTPSVFTSTHFAVFGLGDSNYEAFCETPKRFDEHIARLGGQRMLKRCDADEVEGLETFFDPWRQKLWETLEKLDVGLGKGPDAVTEVYDAESLPTGVPPPQEEEEADGLGSSAEQPLLAPVVAARWLTTEEAGGGEADPSEVRRVLHVELDVSGAKGGMKFEAGDAIAVVPHHDDATVTEALRLLGITAADADAPLLLEGSDLPAHLQSSPESVLSPREALRCRVDLGSTTTWPPLPLLKLLLAAPAATAAATGEVDAPLRARVAQAVAGQRAAHQSLVREKPPLLELLSRLQVAPPLAKLLDALPPLAPRWYSLANAYLASPGRAHLCLTVVTYKTEGPDGLRPERRGLTSHMLARLCAPLLAPPAGDAPLLATPARDAAPLPAVHVPVFKRAPSGAELRLPADPATPIMLVGPGTGLAPFRAFLQERRVRWPRKKLGPCHVFFGCQKEELDFLYSDELRTLQQTGAVELHTAFSRGGDAAAAGYCRGVRVGIPYVQDLLEEQAAEVSRLLLSETSNGHLYVCGDGQHMAADVHAALRYVAMQQLGLSTEAAEAKLAALTKAGRIQREIWH